MFYRTPAYYQTEYTSLQKQVALVYDIRIKRLVSMGEADTSEGSKFPLNDTNLKDIGKISDELVLARVLRYTGNNPITLSEEDTINPGDKLIELARIKDVTKVGHESIQKSILNIKQYLNRHPDIAYVTTVTWLKSVMKKFGFMKSDLPVTEAQQMSILLEAQGEDFRRKVDSLDPNQPDYFGNKFRSDDVGLYYAKPQNIRIPDRLLGAKITS